MESEEIDASARGKRGADSNTAGRLEIAERSINLIRLVGGVLVLVTLWAGSLQWDVADLKRTREARNAQVAGFQQYMISNDKVSDAQKARIDDIRKDTDANGERIKKLEPDVQDMAFMRDHGISNKENYQRTYGRPAPSDPSVEPDPKK